MAGGIFDMQRDAGGWKGKGKDEVVNIKKEKQSKRNECRVEETSVRARWKEW